MDGGLHNFQQEDECHGRRTLPDEQLALASKWGRGEEVSTEDLRMALQRYRSFFQ
ncbi:MAG: hypothetical protein ABIQ47_03825 [Tepidiformaceae bacterium]